MAKFFVTLFVALVALQSGFAKKAKQATTERSSLEQLSASTQTLINNVTHTLGLDDLPDSKQVLEVLNNNTQNLANHLQDIAGKLQSEIKAHQGELDDVVKQVEQKLSETANQLQQIVGPEATAKANELRANLDNGLKTAAAELDKLVKAIEPDATKVKNDLQNAAQSFLNQLADVSNNLQDQVKATVAEHEKSHKKH